MLMSTVLLTSCIGTPWYRPMGIEEQRSYALRVISYGLSSGDQSFFQTILDIIHVDAPLSTMQ